MPLDPRPLLLRIKIIYVLILGHVFIFKYLNILGNYHKVSSQFSEFGESIFIQGITIYDICWFSSHLKN